MVCLRNISVDTLHRGDTNNNDDDDNDVDDDDNNNNNHHHHQYLLLLILQPFDWLAAFHLELLQAILIIAV
jgi:hypothetical protein